MSRYKAYPEYKDSGEDWLGEVPSHWNVIKIKHLSPIKRGASPRPIDDAKYFDDDGEYAWTRIADVTASDVYLIEAPQRLSDLGSSLSVKLEPESLFLSIAGTVGKPCITGIKACIHDGFVYFPELRIPNKFLFYVFAGEQAYKGLGKFGTQLNLNTDTVGGIKIGCTDSAGLEKIVAFLDHETAKIDALIEKQQRLIELLKEKRQAVISHAVTKGLNPNAPMKDSGVVWLGEVPAHWEVLPIKYLSDSIGTGGTPKSEFSFTEEPEISWFTPGDFSNHAKLICSTKHITNRAVANGDAKVFRASSILVIGIGATLGKVALCESNFSCNQQINVVSPNSKAKAEFLVNSLQAQTEQMKQSSNFSTIGIMNQEKTKQLVVAVPPLDEQVAVATFLDEKKMKFDAIESQAVNQIALLQERRTALISAAVTGKIDVRHWQAAA
jgi:type I restriction enzyme S subunit